MQTFYFIPNLYEIFNSENCCQNLETWFSAYPCLTQEHTQASMLSSGIRWLISKALGDRTQLINYVTSSPPVFSETSAL